MNTNSIDTDRTLHEAMHRAHCCDPDVHLEGNLFPDEVRSQRHEVAAEARQFIEDTVRETILEKVVEAAGHHALGAAMSPVLAGYATLDAGIKSAKQGDARTDALNREPAVAACAALCAEALPDGYPAHLATKYTTAQSAREKVLADLVARPDYGAIKAGFQANCLDGQRAALDARLGSEADLNSALDSKSPLAYRYHHDLAFKLGVDSAVWATAHGQKVDVPPSPAPTVSTVRG